MNTLLSGKYAKKCHMCGSKNLSLVLDLGNHPHSDHYPTVEQVKTGKDALYPLRLVSCDRCGLLQIDFFVDPKILYQTDYVYQSLSTTKTGSTHFENLARNICKKFNIPKGSLAVDIGSNTGSLLQCFKNKGLNVAGVDPAESMAQSAEDNGIPTVNDFFNADAVEEIKSRFGKARVITGTNVFAHIHDIHGAVEGMKDLLHEDGLIVIEAPYAVELVRHMEYDTIYHSHIGYLSVKPMNIFFERFGLELFSLERSPMHGGSLQYYVGHKGRHEVSEDIDCFIKDENRFGLYDKARLKRFASDVVSQKKELLSILMNIKKEGKKIAGISAPAKGNTLLNYCGIDRTLLDFITEKNPLKVGRFTPGTHIPIYDDEKLLKEQPEYALILAWNFAEEIMKNLEEYKKRGGKFIIPVPAPRIV